MISSFAQVQKAWGQDMDTFRKMLADLNTGILDVTAEELPRILSSDGHGRDASAKGAENAGAQLLDQVKKNAQAAKKYHRVISQWFKTCAENAPGISETDRERALFWIGQFSQAAVPSNFFWTSPTAVKRCLDTKGESLRQGLQNWLNDLNRGEPLVSIADPDAFRLGENLACTPGDVVFRNELFELIRYRPATAQTFEIPIVLIQPWINKFYIFDLSEHNSLVRYLLHQGFTVFMTSWKNPGSDMRNTGFADYMLRGALKAAEAAAEICGVRQVHAAGYCIGGTVLTALLAWLNRGAVRKSLLPIAHWSVFSTLTDFSTPGEPGVFITRESVEAVERLMAAQGFLDKKYSGMAFRMLRSDSLIWRYVSHNYLHGAAPPKSDMLYWNSDSTRLPEKMLSFYLREFYLANRLIRKDDLELAGRPIDMERIVQPLYAVGAVQDHISPWKGTFRTGQMVGGPVRYVLASEGHITGIVNPVSERSAKKCWIGDVAKNMQPDDWLARQKELNGSWWPDWANWLAEKCGPKVSPPSGGCGIYRPLCTAPGKYVTEP